MGLFGRKKGRDLTDTLSVDPDTGEASVEVALFEGEQEFEVVGEAKYQDSLLTLTGGTKTRDGLEMEQVAVLMPETDHKFDPNAVQILIGMLPVGYLPRHLAKLWQPGIVRQIRAKSKMVAVRARITGGWNRGDGDEGYFGVRLLLDPSDFE